MNIFVDGQDFLNFLKRLNTVLGKQQGSSLRIRPLPTGAFTILSYCLMPNHFHLLIRQNTELSAAKLISKVCTSYSMYFNKKYSHIGGVFQDQYKAVPIDNDAYLLWVSAYIHQNPVVGGLVESLADYPWSSYLDYVGKRHGKLPEPNFLIAMAGSLGLYEKFVEDSFAKIKTRKDIEHLLLDA